MTLFCQLLIFVLIFQHIGFLILEVFLWNKSVGRKIFRMDQQQANATQKLALNQGVYNGFLAAGLIWSLLHTQAETAIQIAIFFSICIVVAGIVGGLSVNKRIFFIQGIPAMLTVICLLL